MRNPEQIRVGRNQPGDFELLAGGQRSIARNNMPYVDIARKTQVVPVLGSNQQGKANGGRKILDQGRQQIAKISADARRPIETGVNG